MLQWLIRRVFNKIRHQVRKRNLGTIIPLVDTETVIDDLEDLLISISYPWGWDVNRAAKEIVIPTILLTRANRDVDPLLLECLIKQLSDQGELTVLRDILEKQGLFLPVNDSPKNSES